MKFLPGGASATAAASAGSGGGTGARASAGPSASATDFQPSSPSRHTLSTSAAGCARMRPSSASRSIGPSRSRPSHRYQPVIPEPQCFGWREIMGTQEPLQRAAPSIAASPHAPVDMEAPRTACYAERMDTARRARSIGFLCLVVTAFGWALNWPLMKLLLQQWPPLFARGLAGTLAALILAALALSRSERLTVPRAAIPRLVFASFTNVFAWMGFGTMAMKYVTVGEGALIAYTMPIWAMLFAWPFLHVRPSVRDVAALVLGILGVALLLGADGFAFTEGKWIGIALALSCAILFALGNVLNRE